MPQSIVNQCKITLKIPKVVSSKCTKKLFSSQQNRENYRILRTKVVELVYKKVNISSPWMEAVLEKTVNQSTKKQILKDIVLVFTIRIYSTFEIFFMR